MINLRSQKGYLICFIAYLSIIRVLAEQSLEKILVKIPFCNFSLRHPLNIEAATETFRNFSLNKNFNVAVAASPPIEKNSTTFLLMKYFKTYSLLSAIPEYSSCTKQVFLNEKSNYNPRFGKPEPYCTT